MTLRKTLLAASLGAALSGCASLAPDLPGVSPDIPSHWNDAAKQQDVTSDAQEAFATLQWRDIVQDQQLRDLIDLALENNRDIRSSLLNIVKTKAAYQIQEANQSVQVTGDGSFERGRRGDVAVSESWGVVGSVSYELDLFKRADMLSDAAWQEYVKQVHHYDAARIALISEITSTYLDFIANQRRYQLAVDTWESREASYALSEKRHELGQVSALSLAQERGLVEAASREVAMHGGNVVKSRQALETLVGTRIGDKPLDSEWGSVLRDHAAISSEMPSFVLLMRPDVRAAEASLMAANAQVGAARAALFPSVRLTGQLGSISTEFSDLMGSGTSLWGISPSLHMPIFDGGRLAAQEKVASIEQQQALLAYEQSLRVAFHEVADILTDMTSLERQQEAQANAVAAARESYRLSKVRYEAGRDDYLSLLDAERTLYSAEKDMISLDLAQTKLQIALYKAFGGFALLDKS